MYTQFKINEAKGYDVIVKGKVYDHFATYAEAEKCQREHPHAVLQYYLADEEIIKD